MAARPRKKAASEAFKPDPLPPRPKAPWMEGDCRITGRAAVDGVFGAVKEADRKWGVGRLRLLLPVELRERWDRQWMKFNTAHNEGDLHVLLDECRRTLTGLAYCSKWATENGCEPVNTAEVLEARLPDGAVLVVCPDASVAALVRIEAMAAGRRVVVYDMAEVARLIAMLKVVNQAKAVFPGATVEEVRAPVHSPDKWHDDSDDVPF